MCRCDTTPSHMASISCQSYPTRLTRWLLHHIFKCLSSCFEIIVNLQMQLTRLDWKSSLFLVNPCVVCTCVYVDAKIHFDLLSTRTSENKPLTRDAGRQTFHTVHAQGPDNSGTLRPQLPMQIHCMHSSSLFKSKHMLMQAKSEKQRRSQHWIGCVKACWTLIRCRSHWIVKGRVCPLRRLLEEEGRMHTVGLWWMLRMSGVADTTWFILAPEHLTGSDNQARSHHMTTPSAVLGSVTSPSSNTKSELTESSVAHIKYWLLRSTDIRSSWYR